MRGWQTSSVGRLKRPRLKRRARTEEGLLGECAHRMPPPSQQTLWPTGKTLKTKAAHVRIERAPRQELSLSASHNLRPGNSDLLLAVEFCCVPRFAYIKDTGHPWARAACYRSLSRGVLLEALRL